MAVSYIETEIKLEKIVVREAIRKCDRKIATMLTNDDFKELLEKLATWSAYYTVYNYIPPEVEMSKEAELVKLEKAIEIVKQAYWECKPQPPIAIFDLIQRKTIIVYPYPSF